MKIIKNNSGSVIVTIAITLLLCSSVPAAAVERVIYQARCSGDTLVQACGDEEAIIFCYDDDCYCDKCYGSYIDRIDDLWPGRKHDSWVDALTHYNN